MWPPGFWLSLLLQGAGKGCTAALTHSDHTRNKLMGHRAWQMLSLTPIPPNPLEAPTDTSPILNNISLCGDTAQRECYCPVHHHCWDTSNKSSTAPFCQHHRVHMTWWTHTDLRPFKQLGAQSLWSPQARFLNVFSLKLNGFLGQGRNKDCLSSQNADGLLSITLKHASESPSKKMVWEHFNSLYLVDFKMKWHFSKVIMLWSIDD